MLNLIWLFFFFSAFAAGAYQWLFFNNPEVFSKIIEATFSMASLSVEIMLGLIGILCFWLGLFRIAEESGVIKVLARVMSPLLGRLMPEVPANHPAFGSITTNLAANMLGLDNAATPMGLKAMKDLQEINTSSVNASNAQILFLVLNTSAVTILPITIFMYRAQQGAADPGSVFIPILLATSVSTFVGLFIVSVIQKIKLLDRVILFYFSLFLSVIAILISYLYFLPADKLAESSAHLGNFLLFTLIILFLFAGWRKRINVYESFIEGAKEGFDVAIKIIPYLVAMLVGIGVFRASGILEGLLYIFESCVSWLGFDVSFVPALPTAILRPFSGSGSRAMMIETMNTYGVDSFPALIAATIQGSTETTFYVLALYFGSVGIKNARHAIGCGLAADFAGITAAILLGYWFFI
ncbi:MAG: nucleoside recognition domain-containing protein [Pseudomonadota bacterium]